MKKLLTILMTLVLVFSLTTSVFADTTGCTDGCGGDCCIEYCPETAWAVVDLGSCYTERNLYLNQLDGIKANKWGFYINVDGIDCTSLSYSVFAGGGKNNLGKGTLIGSVILSVGSDGYYDAEFVSLPLSGHYTTAMHFGVYANIEDLAATNGAPGRFTNNVLAQDAKVIAIHFDAMVAQW